MPEAGPDAGIGDPAEAESSRLERVLHRFGEVRDQSQVGLVLAIVSLAAAAALWWIGRPPPTTDVELNIPTATEAEASGQGVLQGVLRSSQPLLAPTDRQNFDSGPETGSVTTAPTPDRAEDTIPEHAVVHVSGAVARQGLVTVSVDARVAEAVVAAGGPLDTADLHRLNLAARVHDGQHVHVPLVGEDPGRPLIEGGRADETAQGADANWRPTININTADQTALEQLSGIGPATAAAIVQWRLEHGQFQTVDDLIMVSGIGPAKLEAVRDQAST